MRKFQACLTSINACSIIFLLSQLKQWINLAIHIDLKDLWPYFARGTFFGRNFIGRNEYFPEKAYLNISGYICSSLTTPPVRSTIFGVILSKSNTLPPKVFANFTASCWLENAANVGPIDPVFLLPKT